MVLRGIHILFLSLALVLASTGCRDGKLTASLRVSSHSASGPNAAPSGTPSGTPSVSHYNYNQHIAPILQAQCLHCHRDGGAKASIQFNTYDKAKSWAQAMVSAVVSRRMPPWGPAQGNDANGQPYPIFKDARLLSQTQIQMITDWAANGMPEGPGGPITIQPPPVDTLSGAGVTALTIPTLFTPNPGAGRTDQYRCFILNPVSTASDQWMTAFEVVPDQVREVHHAILYKPTTDADAAIAASLETSGTGKGYDCLTGPGTGVNAEILALWAPGTGVTRYPANTGIKVERNRRLIFQIHYNIADLPNGGIPDRSGIRLKTSGSGVIEGRWYAPGKNTGSIPLGQANAISTDMQTLQTWAGSGVTVYGVYPHMHMLGTRIHEEYQRAGSSTPLPLFDVKLWDFHWQGAYFFPDSNPISLKASDSLRISCHYDTTLVNGLDKNGYPRSQPVPFGEDSTDEMCFGFVYGIPHRPFDAQIKNVTGPVTARSFSTHLQIATEHQSLNGAIYVAADIGGTLYYLSAPGQWALPVNGVAAAFKTGALPLTLDALLQPAADLSSFVGATVYIGYGVGATSSATQLEMTQAKRYKQIYVLQP